MRLEIGNAEKSFRLRVFARGGTPCDDARMRTTQAAKDPDEHATVFSYGRHWCLADLKVSGASGCSVFAKRQTTEEKRTTIGESNIVEMSYREDGLDPLTALLRSRALELIQLAVNAALAKVLGQYADAQTPVGRAAIVRNGYHPGREIQMGAEPVMIQSPKVRSQSGRPVSCRSTLVPPYVRKTKTLQPVILWRGLKHCSAVAACSDERGLCMREMELAPTALLGPNATGFSTKLSPA